MAPELSVNHLADPAQIRERLNHRAAHRARLAHRVIRLREVGFGGELEQLIAIGAEHPRAEGKDLLTVAGPGGLTRLVHATLDGALGDRPGPTDSAFAKKLFTLGRAELFAAWKENADEAAHDFDAKGAKQALESEQRDRDHAAELDELAGVAREPYVPHGLSGEWAANALYDFGRQGFLEGLIDWDTATMKVDLVDSGAYTIDLANHEFRSSIAVGARIASSAALASKTVTAGVADAADITYTALSGTSIELIVIYQSSAVGGGADVADTAQRLIAAIDTATGLPFTPSGGDVTVTWDNGANRILKL